MKINKRNQVRITIRVSKNLFDAIHRRFLVALPKKHNDLITAYYSTSIHQDSLSVSPFD